MTQAEQLWKTVTIEPVISRRDLFAMAASDEDAATLRRNVTSPNGVTQAALEVLMADHALPSAFREAVRAAIARDGALSEETE